MGVLMKQIVYEEWHMKSDELTDRIVSIIGVYAHMRGHTLK